MTDPEALRRIVAEGQHLREAFRNWKGHAHIEGAVTLSAYQNWAADNCDVLLSALEERTLSPPAGQDERVREMVGRVRQAILDDDPVAAQKGLVEIATEAEAIAAQLAEADAMIAEMQPRYQHDCNYCQGNTRICERSPRGGCLLRKEQFARHVARASRAGTGERT